MPVDPELRRLAAFTLDPAGGNPAGVWIGRKLPELAEMQLIATDVVGRLRMFLECRPRMRAAAGGHPR
jgi:predicted PhzF superfamily epimerase YddE/YHI9